MQNSNNKIIYIMGNSYSAVVWSPVPAPPPQTVEKEDGKNAPPPLPLKLKITKKQMEEIIECARLQDVPVDRVLSRFIHAVDYSHLHHRRPWAPTLYTIPE
ncbi:hypothetical protein ACP275_13G142800 [Erythranthe tilingii]